VIMDVPFRISFVYAWRLISLERLRTPGLSAPGRA
jgi:hypothetical protein